MTLSSSSTHRSASASPTTSETSSATWSRPATALAAAAVATIGADLGATAAALAVAAAAFAAALTATALAATLTAAAAAVTGCTRLPRAALVARLRPGGRGALRRVARRGEVGAPPAHASAPVRCLQAIGFEVVDVCKRANPRLQVRRPGHHAAFAAQPCGCCGGVSLSVSPSVDGAHGGTRCFALQLAALRLAASRRTPLAHTHAHHDTSATRPRHVRDTSAACPRHVRDMSPRHVDPAVLLLRRGDHGSPSCCAVWIDGLGDWQAAGGFRLPSKPKVDTRDFPRLPEISLQARGGHALLARLTHEHRLCTLNRPRLLSRDSLA